MSQRFYPRNIESRRDAMLNDWFHGERADANRRQGEGGPGLGNAPTTVVALNNSINESNIKSGSLATAVTMTIGGTDRWAANLIVDATQLAALIGGLNGGTNVMSLGAAAFSLDITRTVLAIVPAANSAYTIAAGASYDWVFPVSAFDISPLPVTVTSAIVVANDI